MYFYLLSPFSRYSAPNLCIISKIGISLLPTSVKLYSTLGGTTGYAINPARDLAPRIAHAVLPIPGKGDSDWGYSWIPVIAPIIGAVLGAVCYTMIM